MQSDEPAYRVTIWFLEHGAQLAPVVMGLCVVVVLACSALLWFRQGARDLWALEQWRRWWRSRSRPSGGAGGHSDRYRRTLQSAGWRRRRAQAIRRAGHRCQQCGAGGALDVHHLSYRHLGAELPYELVALCAPCHRRAHV